MILYLLAFILLTLTIGTIYFRDDVISYMKAHYKGVVSFLISGGLILTGGLFIYDDMPLPAAGESWHTSSFGCSVTVEEGGWSNTCPSISSFTISNKTSDVSIDVGYWNVTINDDDGNTTTGNITCSNGEYYDWSDTGNGTKSLSLSTLSYSTNYTIWLNLTDSHCIINNTYWFLTRVFNTSINSSDEDYFTWLGNDTSAYEVADCINDFSNSDEFIAIWNNDTWSSSDGLWQKYYGDGSGTNFSISRYDVIYSSMNNTGSTYILMDPEGHIDDGVSRTYNWCNSTNKGFNYSSMTNSTSTTLSAINSSVTLQAGEAIALWNDTNNDWDLWIPGFLEPDKDVHQWDVIFSKVEDDETWIT